MSDVKSKVSEAEWQLRVDLAACYRLVAHYGWDDLIFTHISARVPGGEHQFLLNPYGMTFDEVTASSLVKTDLEGRKVMESPYEINPAGFTIHSAIHAAREDAKCVLHTHSINGVAVSASKAGVLPISQQSIFVLASLGYHDYEGVALHEGEKPRLVRDLGDKSFLMLRNHGLLTVGATIADAFLLMYLFESACMIQLRAQAAAAELIPIDTKIVAGAQMMAKQVTRSAGGGRRARVAGFAAQARSHRPQLPRLIRSRRCPSRSSTRSSTSWASAASSRATCSFTSARAASRTQSRSSRSSARAAGATSSCASSAARRSRGAASPAWSRARKTRASTSTRSCVND
jgi:ribulose-5-phosphate 4-epimerase/fuculose-1-phosphate aldolase